MTILDNCYNIDILLISLNKKTKITYKNGNNKNTPKSFYSDFGVFFILLQFIVEMYLKHIEKNVVIC